MQSFHFAHNESVLFYSTGPQGIYFACVSLQKDMGAALWRLTEPKMLSKYPLTLSIHFHFNDFVASFL